MIGSRDGTALPTGTVTLLFTDIEGSTRLLEALGHRYRETLADHRRLLRSSFADFHGHEVDTQGDAFFVVFASPSAAVSAAVAAQRGLAAHEWPDGLEARVRMGIHTGEPFRTDEGYVGIDLHRGARICAAGHGGQILVSESTHQFLLDQQPTGVTLLDLGSHRLKDLTQPQRLFQVADAELTEQFPPLKTLDNRPTNLPAQPTLLIGRTDDLDQIAGLLGDGSTRLVTLTGPGGTGKTRLALQAAADAVDEFPGGVFLVTLAAVTDPSLVLPTIAQTLGLREGPGRTLQETMREFLAERTMLLLLDNFEQVVEAAPDIAALVAAAPGLAVLITSREPLRIAGERELPVSPLPVPEARLVAEAGPAMLSQYDAVSLFVERARAVKPTFEVTNANAPAVAEICVRLDGLPLAIELAASRIKVLSPDGMLDRLNQRLSLLTGGARGSPARQQTLRATIDWSYDLLSEPERRLFARLAVFSDGWTVDAAESICDPDRDLGLAVLEGLSSLLDKSLVTEVDQTKGEPRFRMLETILEYATEVFAEDPGEMRVRDVHADHFAELAWGVSTKLQHTEGRPWVARLDEEQGNLRAALAWLSQSQRHETSLRLVIGAWRAWIKNGRVSEGTALMERVLAESPDDESKSHAYAAAALGELYRSAGNFEDARQIKESALPTLRRTWPVFAAVTLTDLGAIAEDQGRLTDARALHEEALAEQRGLGDRGAVAHAMTGLARLALRVGHLDEARPFYVEILTTGRETQDDEFVAEALLGLGGIERREGHAELAGDRYAESLALCLRMRDQSYGVDALAGLAAVALDGADPDRAVRLLGAVDAICTTSGLVLFFPDEREQQLTELRPLLDPRQFESAWADGRSMSFDEAATYALRR